MDNADAIYPSLIKPLSYYFNRSPARDLLAINTVIQFNAVKRSLASMDEDNNPMKKTCVRNNSSKLPDTIEDRRKYTNVSFFLQLSQFSSSCLNFRLNVSIFGWISHFSASRLNFRLLSQFSAECLNFRLDISFFGQSSQFSSSCLNFWLDVSFFVQLSQFSSSCPNFCPAVSMVVQMSLHILDF
ncbi:hypothetical protein V9T40_008165 [Parthenolecanium corni]|uniref:Uncharacterized protein n=1 Tax=Parthenolecanium corni TaxID=536013 RepID=A0AAN9TQX6_9HEMI